MIERRLRALAKECGLRICGRCEQVKQPTDFYKNQDGNCCKSCAKNKTIISARKRKTGWTEEEYKAAYTHQDGKCAICKKPHAYQGNNSKKALAADHSHTSREKRGLLCSNCNPLLGFAQDDPAILRAAADYLENGAIDITNPKVTVI